MLGGVDENYATRRRSLYNKNMIIMLAGGGSGGSRGRRVVSENHDSRYLKLRTNKIQLRSPHPRNTSGYTMVDARYSCSDNERRREA